MVSYKTHSAKHNGLVMQLTRDGNAWTSVHVLSVMHAKNKQQSSMSMPVQGLCCCCLSILVISYILVTSEYSRIFEESVVSVVHHSTIYAFRMCVYLYAYILIKATAWMPTTFQMLLHCGIKAGPDFVRPRNNRCEV